MPALKGHCVGSIVQHDICDESIQEEIDDALTVQEVPKEPPLAREDDSKAMLSMSRCDSRSLHSRGKGHPFLTPWDASSITEDLRLRSRAGSASAATRRSGSSMSGAVGKNPTAAVAKLRLIERKGTRWKGS